MRKNIVILAMILSLAGSAFGFNGSITLNSNFQITACYLCYFGNNGGGVLANDTQYQDYYGAFSTGTTNYSSLQTNCDFSTQFTLLAVYYDGTNYSLAVGMNDTSGNAAVGSTFSQEFEFPASDEPALMADIIPFGIQGDGNQLVKQIVYYQASAGTLANYSSTANELIGFNSGNGQIGQVIGTLSANPASQPGTIPIIVLNGANSVKIIWPDPATNTFTLQQSSDLAAPANWATTGYAITNGFGTNFCTVTPLTGNVFFRLKQ
jgi:hypothetical protein